MRIYEYNAEIGTFEIRQVEHARYELWVEDEKLGSYETPESAALDVATFNTGYSEWDRFENEERNFPATLSDWAKVTEESPRE
jgi:hypothetical protein